MDKVLRSSEQCSLCLRCLRSCPTQAIALAKKQVLTERCIHCGLCISICPEQHYRTESLEPAQAILKSASKKIALVSPLVASAMIEYSPEQIAEAISRLGFDEVYLAESGLKLVAERTREILAKASNFPLITSHCPVVVEYIEKLYPDIVPHLAPVISPEILCLRWLKENFRAAEIVLITACPGRATEMENNSKTTACLTFPELRQLLAQRKIDPAKFSGEKFQSLNLNAGSAFIAQGDLADAVAASASEPDTDFISISGIGEVRRLLDAVRMGEIKSRLLELNFCPGGCVGSPMIANRLSQAQSKERARNYLKARDKSERIKLRLIPNLQIEFKREFYPQRFQAPEPSPDKITNALSSIGLGSEIPLLNCQACGYPSCIEFARSLVLGNADPDFCIPALVRKMSKIDERILRSERLASIGQIASALVHEINNPLGLASGYAQTIATDKRLPADIKEIVELIREEIENAAGFIQSLLSLSRDRPLKFERVNLYEVLSATLRLVSPRLETSGIALKLNYLPQPIFLECDPYGLQQVFTNIVLNAWQAMQRGGTLYVSVQEKPDAVEVRFRDTGSGIKPEHLSKLFDPFFTTKAPGEGTGLGLTIAYNIIELHQGEIRVKSEPGRGAEFIITLPLSQTKSEIRSGERW